ncbi:MAG: type IV pilin-like G/H family protein [Oscillatoriaceae cyanobacterium Prado104]|nr:type IV pilin-like G/H family protein [Oscillatoriaceae cyanobacterium Prado104]
MQLKTKPQLDVRNKQTASTTTIQLKIKPQLDVLNKQTASTTIEQVQKNPQLDAINKQAASTTTVQAKKNPQLDALNKRTASTTTMQAKKKPQLDSLKKPAASTTTVQVKPNPQIDALNKRLASRTTVQVKPNPKFDALNKRLPYSAKNIPSNKKRKFGVEILLKITSGVGNLLEIPGVKTLLKITVVGMILGNLAAIVLPSFMFCGTVTRPARARQYIDSMNRAQQAKYADNGAFSNSLDALGFDIETDITNSRNYNYSIGATKNAAFSYAVNKNLPSYVGAVFLVPVSPASNNDMTTVSILCAANPSRNKQAPTQPPNPILQNGVPVCAAGTKSEAHQYVGLLNSSQEFRFQSSGGFSNSINSLVPGNKQTTNYKYSISATENAAFSYGVSRSNYFHSYVGAVFSVPVSSAANKRILVPVSQIANKDKTTVSILCVANSPGKIQPANPIVQNHVPVCAAGSSEVPE